MSASGPARRAAPDVTQTTWETPPPFFRWRDVQHRFDVDATADASNHLLPTWFGPGGVELDAFEAHWKPYGERFFTNPPYGNLRAWCGLYAARSMSDHVFIEALIPANTATTWFRLCRETATFIDILGPGRLQFWKDGAPIKGVDGRVDRNTTDSMLVRWNPYERRDGATIRLVDWKAPIAALEHVRALQAAAEHAFIPNPRTGAEFCGLCGQEWADGPHVVTP